MSPSAPQNQTIARTDQLTGALLIGALLQLAASIVLNNAPSQSLKEVIGGGSSLPLSVLAPMVLGSCLAWFLQARPILALVCFVLGLAPALSGLFPASSLALFFYGESILFYSNGFLAAFLCVAIPLRWLRQSSAGQEGKTKGKALALGTLLLSVIGTVFLLGDHLFSWRTEAVSWADPLRGAGNTLLLAAWASALFAPSSRLSPPRPRMALRLIFGVVLLRVLLGGAEGILGASVRGDRIIVLSAGLTVVPIAIAYLLRPKISPGLRAVAVLFSLVSCAAIYLLYLQVFGRFEGNQLALLHSIFGFHLPYPQYVDVWKSSAFVTGIFFVLVTLYSSLFSADDRPGGAALALIAVSGIGFGSSHLVLMLIAGGLYFTDLLRRDYLSEDKIENALDPQPSFEELRDRTKVFAQKQQLPEALEIEEEKTRQLVLRGPLRNSVDIDLRLKETSPKRRTLTMKIGIVGSNRPALRLIPTERISKDGGSHRASGDKRRLELSKGELESALEPFPTAEIKIWDAGAEVDFRQDLSGFTPNSLDALLSGVLQTI